MCSAPRKLFRTLLGTDFPHGSAGKEPACQRRRHRRHGFSPWVGKIPWGRRWQPTPVFLPEKSHGQRRLQTTAQSHKELDARTHTHTHTHTPHTSMKWGLLIRPRGPGQVTCRGRPGRKRSWHHTSVPGHSSTLVWFGRAAQGLLQPKAGFPFSHCAQRGFPHRG